MKIHQAILFFVFFMASFKAASQLDRSVWYLHRGVGFDFRTSPPSKLYDPTIKWGAEAMLLDQTGQVQFYAGHYLLLNREGEQMPSWEQKLPGQSTHFLLGSGDGYGGHNVVIVPFPSSGGKYFVIHTHLDVSKGIDNALYSIVDMQADGGNGDIKPEEKNIVFDSGVWPGVRAVRHSNMRDYWLILRNINQDRFYVYLVNPNGISERTGEFSIASGQSYGQMRISPDGRVLACTADEGVELYAFNNSTGTITFQKSYNLVENSGPGYPYVGMDFSPNAKFLYLQLISPSDDKVFIYQLDISGESVQGEILASRNMSFFNTNTSHSYWGGVQLGIDGRIYLIAHGALAGWNGHGDKLDVILNPNEKGQACTFTKRHIDFGTGGHFDEFPNFPTVPKEERKVLVNGIFCAPASLQFRISHKPEDVTYLWNFGDGQTSTQPTPTHTYTTAGDYTATLTVTYTDNTTESTQKTITIYDKPNTSTIKYEP